MDIKEEEFLKRLLATFKLEAEEHLHAISTGLIELEKSTDSKKTAKLIETIFREAHSLKGAARSVNIRDIETICQALEDAFAALKRKEISLTQDSYDLLHKAVDNIKQLVSVPDSKQSSSTQLSIGELIQQLLNSTKGVRQPGQAKEPARKQPVKEVQAARDETIPASLPQDEVVTVRIPKTKLEPLFFQAEEMIQAKIATAQRAAELQALSDSLEWWKTESRKWKTRHSTNRGHNYNEWMEWNEQRLEEIEQKMLSITRAAEVDQRIVGRMVDDHLEAMKTILMLPVASLVEVFPLLVRDLASDQNKQVELILHGTELEVDKRILEELKDPLIHLLRNCVDHGIEKP
ncbi:MAG: Hpt domain-containing protein, partial [Proteobacteria bacterium]|nr:Hpt domain-containing protein [Pseudomonadota bacterium]